MSEYKASIKITVVTAPVVDRYGKEEKSSKYHELLEIEIKATTLEKLQEKITAHILLVEDM